MGGIVTRHRAELTWPAFDRGVFELKRPSGRVVEPAAEGVNLITCFGDTTAVASDPSLAARTADGRPATPESADFDRGFVCPSRTVYRERLLELVEEAAEAAPDVRLDDVGFPAETCCRCEACETAFERSDETDRDRWRAGIVTDFVADVARRVPGELSVAVYPDPDLEFLRHRTGLDLDSLADHVDEFVVPLYDTAYGTTYWIDAIAGGFARRITTPVSVELFAGDVEVDALARASRAAARHADRVYYGYDAATARALLRRERASANAGVDHR